ncbi:hypothetical protein PVK62_12990 [Aliivibrio sp. S3MY1]|uniref:hypothetical protein n=1 Tax=unclassified Aliivibrio TaxID=2645654 RepID=UPI0023781E05|nr:MULTISPECIES: hypothetical protein [unclassified Aliivibrio]MDD9196740.1 hypothetical protein [Aliivibrio sp. S3MY1]MDD9200487.1 hypothetical protein [Aliivibrio sp. S2MY1]
MQYCSIAVLGVDWNGQFFVGLSIYLHLTPNIRVNGGLRYVNLEENSMIEHTTSTTSNLGVSYYLLGELRE